MKTLLIAKRQRLLALTVLSLGLVPIIILGQHIDLFSHVSDANGLLFSLLTDSAGSKGFIITLIAFSLLALSKTITRAAVVKQMPILVLLLLLSFVGKSALKLGTEVPRPYTEVISTHQLIDSPGAFYQLSRLQQNEVIKRLDGEVSQWRLQHWLGETDYSFPSGHTLFASLCVAFFGGIFLNQKRYLALTLTLTWAIAVAYSRLWLGMHHPADLYGSLAFICLVVLLLPHSLPLPEYIEKTLLDKGIIASDENSKRQD
ncbi:phosphatase PAP2 family protein [Vibrio sp. IRLE0018]|uniref:phosphatase PAP2 family protein n=1 Tax=Vibrio floridensis TaxID=2908007 RepID=UPI001F2BF56B|nr:phosphatase PAP2 family protein [Vibrio floridensis]MCF8780125.1 phosphatase PAP2 family protein [Vibrio floridensis]